jgi:K+-sensing histidine kinase KdpD
MYDEMGATFFAPAGRETPDTICRQRQLIESAPLLKQTLDAMPSMVMVLNNKRQIVMANENLLDLLGTQIEQVTGKRPGEIFGCAHASEGPDGCGTGRHCTACAAVNAILECQKTNAKVAREGPVLLNWGTALDLNVTVTPIRLGDEQFVFAAVEDTSQAKRLAVLRRTFFHDVLNTAGCIQGYASHLSEEGGNEPEVCEHLARLSGQLIESIRSHRDLLSAESGDLKPYFVETRPAEILGAIRDQYARHPAASGRLLLVRQGWDGAVQTDPQLLVRVLGNMVKNALEASQPGETVTLSCFEEDDQVTLAVHNPQVMPVEVQLQIFQRSFSTKGQSGRGIGAYSMKLFGEQYLGGRVDFISREPEGTTFRLTLPKDV